MNVDKLKEDAKFCKQHNFTSMASVAPQDVLDLIAAYEGEQFAAASHLRTVEQQAKIIAGMQAAPIQSGDEQRDAFEQWHSKKFAWMSARCSILNFNYADQRTQERWETWRAALASTPSAAMQGQGVPKDIEARTEAIRLAHANPHTRSKAQLFQDVEYLLAHICLLKSAAQPQAGGRELTDAVSAIIAVARVLADRSADECNVDREDNWKFYSDDFMDEAKAAINEYHRITGTKGATE